MDLVLELISFARTVGSFLCFQWEVATFKAGEHYFPVCAGCFGIYLGSLLALSCFPFLKKWSEKLFSVKWGLPLALPMVIYWAILNVERAYGTFPVPGIKELYGFTGVLLGLVVSNAAYNLCLETPYGSVFARVGRKLWISGLLLILTSVTVFILYPVEIGIVFTASFIFLIGFSGLAGYIVAWVSVSTLSEVKDKKSASARVLVSILRLSVTLVCFMFFQVLIFESRQELVALGLLLGLLLFVILGHSLRSFTPKELGLVRKDWLKQSVCGVFIGLVLYGFHVVYRFVSFPSHELAFSHFNLDFPGVLVVFAIVVSEEFFFRGYAISLLNRQMNVVFSCVISSLFFVVYHEPAMFRFLLGSSGVGFLSLEYALTLFAGGLLLSFFFAKKKSLTMPIVVHFVWNLLILGVSQ